MIEVMIVEDEQKIREGLKILLEDVIKGFTVLWEADNGERALEILNIEVPELVISDVRMPQMNGIELTHLVKLKYPNIPVLLISGYDDFTYVRKGLQLGVEDYLLKPINRKELASVLDGIFKLDERRMAHRTNESIIIREIKELISNNLEGDLSLDHISKVLNLHPNYISNLYRQQTGIKLSDYILKKRMERAKALLQETNLKIYDIAYLTGFSNPKYFSQVFRSNIGETPSKYRDRVNNKY